MTMFSHLDSEYDVSDRHLYKMLARFVFPYWRSLIGVFVLLLGVTAVTLLPPYLIQRVVDGPLTDGDLDGLIPFAVIYLLSIPTLFALRFSHVYLLQTVGQNALMDLRQELFEHIIQQDMHFFTKTPVGQLVSRLSNDIEALTEMLSTSIVIVASNLITLVGIIFVMFSLNWRLALIGLAALPVMTILTIYFRTRIRRAARRLHTLIGEYQAFINEQANGMLEVQLFSRQDVSRKEFCEINLEYRNVHENVRDWYTRFSSILQLLTAIGVALVLYGGGRGVMAQWATLGMLISFIEYSRRSFVPILQLSEQFAQIQSALSAGERIAQMLNIDPEIVDPEEPLAVDRLKTSITFENVDFWYNEGTPVIRDLSLHIQHGQRVAIVGATGAGKTSMAGLIARFYEVKAGSIQIDGTDIRDITLADLRRHVMVVPQTPYCFNGSIADNLRLFNENITYEQMKEAARVARAAPFIERLPGGYDFELLPGAANLSQGQRQLLALARALIHNPDSILVLDEATSNIDTETEAYIQEALSNVLKNRTSITIAHRLSTVRDADRILVMKHGEIVEDGTHHELLSKGGIYANLVQRQFAEIEVSDYETQAYSG